MSKTPLRHLSKTDHTEHSKYSSTTRSVKSLSRMRQLGQALCVGLAVTTLTDDALGRSEYLDMDSWPIDAGFEISHWESSTANLGSSSIPIQPGLIPGTDLDPHWSLPLTTGFTSIDPQELVRFESQEYWYDASDKIIQDKAEAFEWFGWLTTDEAPELTIGIPSPYKSLRAMDEVGYRSTSWMVGQATLGVVPLPSAAWQGGAVLVGLGIWRWTRRPSGSNNMGCGERNSQICDFA